MEYRPLRAAQEDACALLERFFEHRHGLPGGGRLFSGQPLDAEALGQLGKLLKAAGGVWGDDVHYALAVWYDANLAPGLLAHEDALPDLLLDIMHVSVWHDRAGGRRAKPPDSRSALLTVLLKIMPENGQPRELNRFVARAAEAAPDQLLALHAITQCALLGNYRYCRFKLGAAARANVAATFTPEAFRAALNDGAHGNLFLFYVLREYMHVAGKYVPSYRLLMGTFFLWEKQNSRVCDMMRETREEVDAAADWRVAFTSRACTDAYKRHYRRMPKRKLCARELCPARTLLLVAERTCRARKLRSACAVFDVRAAARLGARPGAPPAVPELLAAAGEHSAAASAAAALEDLTSQRSASKALALILPNARMSDEDLKRTHDAAIMAARGASTFVVPLPPAFARRQAAAVARRFGCAEDDWPTIRRAARVYVCPCCARVKNFVLEKGAKATFLRASGYEKMVYPSPLDGSAAEGPLACASTPHCRMFSVTALDLLAPAPGGRFSGGVLQAPGACITVTPCCGVLAALASLRAWSGGYSCPACTVPPPPLPPASSSASGDPLF